MELGEVHGLVDTAARLGRAAGGSDGGAGGIGGAGELDGVAGVAGGCGARERLVVAARAAAGLRRWLDGLDVQIARELAEVDARSEQTLADAGRTSSREVAKVVERVETTDTVPALGVALDAGDVSAGHVDVVTAVLRQVQPDVRAVLVDNGTWLARRATVLSPVELHRELAAEVRALAGDGGTARLERQRRAARLRTWVDPDGMWRFDGRFDPETGLRLHTRLLATTQQLFADQAPPEAPTDPIERQAFLRARAWVALVDRTATTGTGTGIAAGTGTSASPGTGTSAGATANGAATRNGGGLPTGTGPPELIVVLDATAPDPAGLPTIDWGLPLELPLDVLHRCFDEGHLTPIIVRNGVILHAPGVVNLGRTTRLANRAQRRALRALYPTCAIPGCDTRYELCKLHHVIWWEHGGRTDLDNLLPLCVRHHHAVHDQAWQLKLTPDRQLTITYPDGTTHTTGPPRRNRNTPPPTPLRR
jgi:hypothetical protein